MSKGCGCLVVLVVAALLSLGLVVGPATAQSTIPTGTIYVLAGEWDGTQLVPLKDSGAIVIQAPTCLPDNAS